MIIGSGPSLEPALPLIRGSMDRFILHAANSTLKTLISHDIRPHFVVGLELRDQTGCFSETPSLKDVCGIFSSACHPSFYEFPFEKVFIYNLSEFPFGEMVLKHKQLPSIPGGGTVSIPALFSAYIMGSRGILFFGQDLAFSKGRKYASGSGGLLRHSDSESIQVSGVNGTNVETTKGFHAGIQQMSMMAGLFKE